jgi:hypothetical protein
VMHLVYADDVLVSIYCLDLTMLAKQSVCNNIYRELLVTAV